MKKFKFLEKFKIGNKVVGGKKTYIIAEGGSNHNGDILLAKKLIDIAVKAKADAIKFQLFKADNLLKKSDKLYKNLKKLEFKKDWIKKTIQYSNKKKIDIFFSVFDQNILDYIIKKKIKGIKIASSEIKNLNLIKKAAQSKIPLIISTGMSDLTDIHEAIQVIKEFKNNKIALMQCSSVYPCKPHDINLNVIDKFKSIFNFPIGFSDHSNNILPAVAAVSKGAKIVEIHFTFDKNSSGPDHFYSLSPDELNTLIKNIRYIETTLGDQEKKPLNEELKYCRKEGLYAKKNLKINQKISYKNIKVKNPQLGIQSRFLRLVSGQTLRRSIKKNNPIKWSDIK